MVFPLRHRVFRRAGSALVLAGLCAALPVAAYAQDHGGDPHGGDPHGGDYSHGGGDPHGGGYPHGGGDPHGSGDPHGGGYPHGGDGHGGGYAYGHGDGHGWGYRGYGYGYGRGTVIDRGRPGWWRGNPAFVGYAGFRPGYYFAPGYGYYAVPPAYARTAWVVGAMLPPPMRRYVVFEPAVYGLRPPPPGYGWYYAGNNFVLAAASGVIVQSIAGGW